MTDERDATQSGLTIWVTSANDDACRTEHAVPDEQMTRRQGIYMAVCGTALSPAAMTTEPDWRCNHCLLLLQTRTQRHGQRSRGRGRRSCCPRGVNPAPPEDLSDGFLPAESENTAEDTMYSVRAADDLVARLGFDPAAGPWLDRVIVRICVETGPQAAVCSAHTVVPYEVVAGHDPSWRSVEFGQVAVPGAIVVVEDTWITTHRASAWDVEELAVLAGSPINVVWLRLTLAFQSGIRLPGGLVFTLPANRIVFASPIPEQVRDQRVSVHREAA